MEKLKYMKNFLLEGADDNDWGPEKSEWEPLRHDKKILTSEAKDIAWKAWSYVYEIWSKADGFKYDEKLVKLDFDYWWEHKDEM